MNKKISLGAAIAFAFIVAAAVFSITWLKAFERADTMVASLKEREQRYSKITEIESVVRQNYAGTFLESVLTDDIAKGLVAGLGDPYAEYYDAATYKILTAGPTQGPVQIGIVPEMDESGYMRVEEVYPDSPAQAAGIEPGNLIIRIDDLDITKDNYQEAVERLEDEQGTKVTIILRQGVEDSTLELTRRNVEVPSVQGQMLDKYIGLITFKEFNQNTPEQFSRQVDDLVDQGANSLIFDVRGVDTGTQRSVAQVLDELLPKGDIILSVDKDGKDTVLATSDAREINLPMAVLINEKTSGEAELFAQDLRDFNKARLVGTRTAGKGTVQEIIPLSDGSAVQLTVAKYRTPFSASYDKEGVRPDYEVKMTEDQVALMESVGQEYDLQLKKAVELVQASVKANGDFTEVDEEILYEDEEESQTTEVLSEDEEESENEDEESQDEDSSSQEDNEDSSSEDEESSSEEEADEDASSSEAEDDTSSEEV